MDVVLLVCFFLLYVMVVIWGFRCVWYCVCWCYLFDDMYWD